MVILGLLLIALGIIATLAAFFVSEGTAELLGMQMSPFEIFLVGLVAGAFILWGFTILKFGTRRELLRRKERKELDDLSARLKERDGDRRNEEPDES